MRKKMEFYWMAGILLCLIGFSAALAIRLLPETANHPEVENAGASGAVEAGSAATPPVPSGQDVCPAEWLDNGIFSDCYQEAYEQLKSMSVEEQIGQLFLARCPDGNLEALIQRCHPGGFVLFREDFNGRTKQEVIDRIAACQKASKIPMLMAVDEEGGTVVRISGNPLLAPERFPSPQSLYNTGGLDAVGANIVEKSALLRELGLNLNLAPVADVSTDPKDYIYPRTLGRHAEETAQYVAYTVQTSRDNGVFSTLKHFPGYGNNRDTHTGVSIDSREYEQFEKVDFLPFRSGIEAGAEAVLVSHNTIRCMDPDNPASLSASVHELLREELGFTGLIMTDDLYMDAIRLYGNRDAAVTAVLAGNDLLVTTEFEKQYQAVRKAVEEGTIPLETIRHAAFRVLAMKLHTGILSSS